MGSEMKFSIYRTIGTLGFFSLVTTILIKGGSAIYFVNIPTALILICLVFLTLLCIFEKDFLLFVPRSFLCLFFTPQAPVEKYTEISKYGSRLTIGSAIIMMIIIYIQILSNSVDLDNIGLVLSHALLPIFYALLLSEFFFVIVLKAYSSKGRDASVPEPSLHIRSLFLLLLAIGAICLTCMLLFAALQPAS